MAWERFQRSEGGILPSHRAGLYYLEYTRVQVVGESVAYTTSQKSDLRFHTIPAANTSAVLLGPGTSITSAALGLLSRERVMVGVVTGSAGTLLSGSAPMLFEPINEYRSPTYQHTWAKRWFDEGWRLNAAKALSFDRIRLTRESIDGSKELAGLGAYSDTGDIGIVIDRFESSVPKAADVQSLLGFEGTFVKGLYAAFAKCMEIEGFRRDQDDRTGINGLLTQGNYVAYGLAATSLWSLGLGHAFPLSHGSTRQGGLVFDVADLIKTGPVLTSAFLSARQMESEKEFRKRLFVSFDENNSLSSMFDSLKKLLD